MCYILVSLFKMSTLLDKKAKGDYTLDIAEEYEELREDHYDSLKVCKNYYKK